MKLGKQMWINAKGEKKVNNYKINIPKAVVEESGITDKDEVYAYADNKKIIIERVKRKNDNRES